MFLVLSLLACTPTSIKLDGANDTGLSDGSDSGGGNSGDTGTDSGGDTSGGTDTSGGGSGGGNGGDTGTPVNAYAGSYRGTLQIDIPDYDWTMCTADVDLLVSDAGALSSSAECRGDMGYGMTLDIPLSIEGTVGADGAIAGNTRFSIDFGWGDPLDVDAEVSGAVTRRDLSLSFPFTIDFGRDVANAEGSVSASKL